MATLARIAPTETIVNGSRAPTPNRSIAIKRVKAIAPAVPIASPISVRRAAVENQQQGSFLSVSQRRADAHLASSLRDVWEITP